jgi:hypothetical protein
MLQRLPLAPAQGPSPLQNDTVRSEPLLISLSPSPPTSPSLSLPLPSSSSQGLFHPLAHALTHSVTLPLTKRTLLRTHALSMGRHLRSHCCALYRRFACFFLTSESRATWLGKRVEMRGRKIEEVGWTEKWKMLENKREKMGWKKRDK